MADKAASAFDIATPAVADYVLGVTAAGAVKKFGVPSVGGVIPYPDALFWKGPMPRLAAARARGASVPPRIVVVGHSHTVGQGAGTGGTPLNGARPNGLIMKMATALGWQTGSWYGDGNVALAGVNFGTYDPRIVMGSWASDTNPTFGGKMLTLTGASASDFQFTPEQPFDNVRFRFYSSTSGVNTSVRVKLDGATLDTFTLVGGVASTYMDKTYTVTRGSHTLAIQALGASGLCNPMHIETRDSTSSAPMLILGGVCGGGYQDYTLAEDYPFKYRPQLVTLAADVVLVYGTANDVIGNQSIANVFTGIDSLAKAAKQMNADFVGCVDSPFDNAGCYDGTVDKYQAILRMCSSAYGGGFFDGRGMIATYPRAVADGLQFDSNHPNTAGHALLGAALKAMFQ